MNRLFGKKSKRRIAVIGLDCGEPSLVFERFAADLPTLARLRARGAYGALESVIPAITVPAWSCMMSGKDPGTLGVYGFRNRRDFGYGAYATADARAIHEPRLWDILTQNGKESIVLSVPGTYPLSPLHGKMLGCFLTPPDAAVTTYPPALRADVERWIGGAYRPDVKDFRTEDKAWLLEQIHSMTRERFEVARRLLDSTRAWDFFIMVEMGVDRIHHAFWKDMDDPASPFRDAIRDYYVLLDGYIAELLTRFDDDTLVFVLSDHGAKGMEGGICLNEWLLREGYLKLLDGYPQQPGARFDTLAIDWAHTLAWGDGGYYGRVFFNVRGREPQGIVPPEGYEQLQAELRARLEALGDERGAPIGTRCFAPSELYPIARGVPPDLLVYFGDLRWRSIGSLGWNAVHVHKNDTGPDDANHAQHGILLFHDPARDLGGQRVEGMRLLQVAPTILKLFRLPVPGDMRYGALEALLPR